MSELDFDTLKLNIEADASQASNSIQELTNNIRNLGKSLKIDGLKSFADNLKNIGGSVSGLSEVTNRINETSGAINQMVEALKKPKDMGGFGISTKGIEVIKEKLAELYEVQRKIIEESANTAKSAISDKLKIEKPLGDDWEDDFFENIGKASENATERLAELREEIKQTIEEFATYKNKMDDTAQSIYDYVKKSTVNVKGLEKEFATDFESLRKKLGANFNHKQYGTPYDKFVEVMDEDLGTSFSQMGITEAYEKLASILETVRLKTIGYKDAVKLLQEDETASSQQTDEFVGKMRLLVESVTDAESKIKNAADSAKEMTTATNGQGISGLAEQAKQASGSFDSVSNKLKEVSAFPEQLSAGTEKVVKDVDRLSNALDQIINRDHHTDTFIELPGLRLDQIESSVTEVDKLSDALNTIINRDYGDFIEMPQLFSESVEEAVKEVDKLSESLDKIIGRDYGDFIKLPGLVPEPRDMDKAIDEAYKSVDWNKFYPKTPKIDSNGTLKNLAGFVTLEHELTKIADILNKVGDTGVRVSKMMLVPLKAVVNEYKEKLEKVTSFFADFRRKAQANLKKLSDFWKRTMKTFTFMLVRKAITAILGNIDEATQSLAAFSKEMGTSFNENMSNAIADLKWVAKAIVGAFEPVINYVVPILNKLSAALVRVITLIGEFFAALTGQGYYMVAKKKVEDYTKSVKKAQKATQLSIRGFDELNNLTSGKNADKDDDTSNPADDWEMKPVSDKMKKLADMIKDLAKKLWEPIGKAWDRTKDYVISSFKYMVNELNKLAKDIGRDFLKVWRQEATVKMFENIFKIVGDIERVIGNLAKRFREAWNEGSKGLHIFENIRDIFATLIQHIRNVTRYMIDWSDSIDFNPLLESVQTLTKSFVTLADFIGSVFEDVMKNVVLKYIKWMIEDGTPHLLHTISEIINAVDWENVRRGLFIIEQAFENLLENVHTGVTNAIGALGKVVAEWLSSDKFIKFMQALANIMNQITAERVQKVLEGLGLAILHIAQNVADFISGDTFQDFIEGIGKWIDNHSAEDIANIAQKIIELSLAFKALAALASKGAGILSFFSKLVSIKIGTDLVKGLLNVGKAGKAAKDGFVALGGLPGTKSNGLATLKNGIDGLAESLQGLTSSAGGKLATLGASLKTVLFGDIGANLAAGGATAGATFAAALIGGVAAAIGGWNIGQLIDEKLNGESIGMSFMEQMKGIKDSFTNGSWKGALDLWGQDIVSAWSEVGNNIKDSDLGQTINEKWQTITEGANQIKEDVTGAFSLMKQDVSNDISTMGQEISTRFEPVSSRVEAIFQGIGIIIKAVWVTVVGWIKTNVIQPIVGFFQQLWQDIQNIWNSVSTWFNTNVVQPVVGFFRQAWQDISGFFTQLWADIKSVWNTVSTWFNTTIVQPVVGFFRQAWQDIKGFFTQLWADIKGVWGVVAGWFNATIIQPLKNAFNAAVGFIKGLFTSLWTSIKNGVKAAFNFVISVVEKAINGIISGVNSFLGLFNKVVDAAATITHENWSGVELIPKITLPRFETGGFPEDGWFRASHGEMIGEFDNGQSVVANNEQIVNGIKAGVIDGMMQILPSLAQAVQSGETTVNIEGDMGKLFRAMVKENSGMNKRTFGSSPLLA